jgi:V8-like Glu-specific endopeptidase
VSANFNKFEEQIFLGTVLIENRSDNEMGTGFLIGKPVGGNYKVLLFSNKHVFWGKKDKDKLNIEKQIHLTFHTKESDETYTLEKHYSFDGKITRDAKYGYYDHPDPAVDVACANISGLNNRGIKLHISVLKTEDFLNFERGQLRAGMKILFVGYPTGYFDKKNLLPIMRSGIIASIPSVDFNGERQILVDAQVFPGSSGSPVFTSLDGKYKLIGMLSDGIQKILDFTEIQKIDKSDEVKKIIPVEWMGLGLLFTSETIKDVYDLA